MRQASLARAESSRKEPGALAPLALRKHLIRYPAGDPRAVTTLEEDIENTTKLTLADVKKFYADFFGASNAELVVVGDFDWDDAIAVWTPSMARSSQRREIPCCSPSSSICRRK